MGGVNEAEEGAQSPHVGRPFATTEDELKWLLQHATSLYEMFREMYHRESDRAEALEEELELAHTATRELHHTLSDLVDHTDATCVVLPVRDRYRSAWISARRGRREAAEWQASYQRAYEAERRTSLRRWGWLVRAIKQRDRYRSAWISARRRAAMESVYATAALELRDADVAP